MKSGNSMGASSRAVRDSTRLVSAHVAGSLFSLCYFALLTRSFSKFDISVLAVAGMLSAVGCNFGGLGLMAKALQQVPGLRRSGRDEEAANTLKICIACSIAATAALTLVLMLAANPLSMIFFKAAKTSRCIVAACMLLISYRVFESVNQSLQAVDDFRTVARLRLCNDIVLRIVAFPIYFVGGIIGYLFALSIGQMALAAFVARVKGLLTHEPVDWSLARRLLRESLPFYGLGIVRLGSMQADSLLVGILLQPNALATYYVIRRFYDYLTSFIDAILLPLIPKVAERRENMLAVANVFHRSSRYLLAISILLLSTLVPFSGQILAVFGGSSYMSGVSGLRWFFTAAVLYGLFSLHGSFILAVARPRDSLVSESLASICNILFGAWLISAYDVTGAAMAKTAAILFAASASFWILTRPVAVRILYDLTLLKRLLPACLAAALAALLIQAWMPNVIAVFLTATPVLGVLLLSAMRFNPDDVDFIVSSLNLERWPLARYALRFIRD